MKISDILLLLCLIIINLSTTYAQTGNFYKDAYFKKQKPKKYQPTHAINHKDTKEFVKKLEYAVNTEKQRNNFFDVEITPLDLHLFGDNEIAEKVATGVEDELLAIDKEMGDELQNDSPTRTDRVSVLPPQETVSLMHQGIYTPASKYNYLIDGLIENVVSDFQKRDMDPLYFGVHNNGVVRHSSKKRTFHPANVTNTKPKDSKAKAEYLEAEVFLSDVENEKENKLDLLGVGTLRGLEKLIRFGDTEVKDDGRNTWVRSHYFFGPLDLELIFGRRRGVRVFNSTLNALAAHALVHIGMNEQMTLKEFLIDSPMDYQIRLHNIKNARLKSLGEKALERLFKRGNRMEVRIERSFRRGLEKPIKKIQKESMQADDKRKRFREPIIRP